MLRWPFLLIVVLAPLPLGSNRPIPWTVLALAVGLLLLAWSVAAAVRPAARMVAPDRLWPAIGGLGLVLIVAVLQVLPFTPRGWQHPLWIEAAAVLGAEAQGRVSANPSATGTATMLLLTYAGVFWLALQLGREPAGARRIVQTLVVAGFGYAIYGLIVFLLDFEMVLWWRKWTWMTGLTSSFVNRNSYATYAGLGLLCAAGMLITTVYRHLRSPRARRSPWRLRLVRVTWRGWWLLAAAAALGFALLLTKSRAGVGSSAAGLAVLVASFGATRLMRERDVAITGGVALVLCAAMFAFGGDDLADRLAQQGMQSEPRVATYQRIAGAIGDAPWLGTGYGTFAEVYLGYQTGVTGLFWNHAHNTYLENAFELGIPAAAALVGAIGWIVYGCARSLHRRRASALYPCLGIAATALVGLHSLLDFSLEIPAIAVTYATIMGVAYGRARRSAGTGRQRALAAWRSPRHRLGIALSGLVATGILALAVPRLTAELVGLPGEVAGRQLAAGLTLSPGALDRAVDAGEAAAAWSDAGASWFQVADAQMALARQADMLPGARRSHLELAEAALRHSLAQAPANSVAWAQLAFVALALQREPAVISATLALSVRTGPADGGVMPLRSSVAALAWPRLDQRTRALFRSQFARTMDFAPQQFVEAVRRTDGADVVHGQLEDEPELRDRFDRLLLVLGRS